MVQLLRGHENVSVNCVESDISGNHPQDTTPLHAAAAAGHVETVHALLQMGANASFKDREGFSALDRAIESQQSLVAEAIMLAGAIK